MNDVDLDESQNCFAATKVVGEPFDNIVKCAVCKKGYSLL